MGRTCILAAAGLLATSATAFPRGPIPIHKRQNETGAATTHDDLVRPSLILDWQPCHQDSSENFQCTWLTVPLDYANVDVGTADIALIRYLVSEDAEDLYYNPGGPGASGIEAALDNGETWAGMWGMNIVSFDPRSVGKSDPKVSCSSPPSGNETITRRQEDSIIVGDLKGMWDKKLKEQSACAALNKDTGMKYIGTSAVVQDLIYFIEQQALLKGEDPETAQINYFGTSYGTAIGQTLVAMYPQRLRRVLLDGNIYAVAHYQGWEPNGVDDFAHGIYMFSKLCFEAGAKWCPLAEGMDSIEDVQARFDAVVLALAVSPIDCKSEQPPFDHNSFMGMVSGMMYSARAQYPQLANLTVQVEAALLAEDLSAFCASPASAKLKKREDAPAEGDDGVLVISAVDMAGRYPWSTYEEFKAAAEALEATAPYGAWTYATQNGMFGLGFEDIVPPPSQYVDHFENGTIFETSVPVLFVNTPGDPVTPMSSARQMSKLFAGSSVFIVDIPGHGYLNAPSKCANDIIATYFKDGTVPDPETEVWCQANENIKAEYYFGAPLTKESA